MKSKISIICTGKWTAVRVFSCLVLLAVAACGSRSPGQPAPDTIFTGQFLTLDAETPRVEALAVSGGRIVAMGSVAEIESLAGPATRRIAVPGVALPGWAEAHGHPAGVAPRPGTLDFYAMSKGEVLASIRKAAEATPPGEWITGRAWDEGFWDPPNFPTAADLDAISTRHPMRFSRLGGHGSWVNSKALELGKIARATPDPPGGRIVRDAKGNATGFLVDRAQGLLPRSGPSADADETSEARLRAGLQQYARWGVTSVHDAGADLGRIAIYKKLLDAGELPVRVYVMASSGPAQEHYLKAGPEPSVRGLGMLSIRSFKLMLDGSLGGRGAALTDAYSDAAETHGVDMMTEGELDSLIREARAKGFQINPHVIGDRAVSRALDAFERGAVTPADRFRLEHASVIRPEDVSRIVKLGVIASMQSVFVGEYSRWADARLGPERALWVKPVRRLLDAGVVVAQGTDYPASDTGNPVFTLVGLVTRQDAAGRPERGWHPNQAVTVDEALRTMSIGPAYAAFQENELGKLAKGYYADFTVLSNDPYKVPTQELRHLQVRMTVVGGQVTFDTTQR
jgi:predicted amidohydrolase YtcJ